MNFKSSSPRQARRRGSPLLMAANIILGLALLLAVAGKYLFVPLIAEPVLDRWLATAEGTIGERLGAEVQLDYTGLDMSLGPDSLFLVVANPSASFGGHPIGADEAVLVVPRGTEPTLALRGLSFQVEITDDGGAMVAGLSLEDIPLLLGDEADGAAAAIPAPNLVVEDALVTVALADGTQVALPPLTAGLSPDAEAIELSVISAAAENASLTGNVRMPLTGPPVASFHFSASGIDPLLAELGLEVDSRGLAFEAWGTASQEAVEATVLASAAGIGASVDMTAEGAETARASLTGGNIEIKAQVTVTRPLSEPTVGARWLVGASDVAADLPPHMIGKGLELARVEAGGQLSASATSWLVQARDMRAQGIVGTGAADLVIGTGDAGAITVDLRAHAPVLDVGEVTALLPDSLSERGVPFLRNDLVVPTAQLATLVVSGRDFTTFPWKDGRDGTFMLAADFYGASLDYAQGYPPLANAYGGFGLEGAALAVTVASGTAGPVSLDISRAGVDDLDADVSTLYVALDASLPDGALSELLTTLPATRGEAGAVLQVARPSGEQGLELALTINLDEDVPVGVAGRLVTAGDSNVEYLPEGIAVERLHGGFDFGNDGVSGVAKGSLLGSDVRLSVMFYEGGYVVQIDGNYDIAGLAARFGRELPVPISGASPISARITDDSVVVTSDLRGSAINLPAPFGKSAGSQQDTTLILAGDKYDLRYGDGLVKVSGLAGSDAVGIAIGRDTEPVSPPASGIAAKGRLSDIDLDALLAGAGLAGDGVDDDIVAELVLENALLLGQNHIALTVSATVAATVTVVSIAADDIDGTGRVVGGTVQVSLSRLVFPDDEDDEQPGDGGTIFVELGVLSAQLPPLEASIDDLWLGKRHYSHILVAGHPEQDTWVLSTLAAQVGSNSISASGTTNTSGEPLTQVRFAVALEDLGMFVANYSKEGASDSVQAGGGSLVGVVSWNGALDKPHLLSMTGHVDLEAKNLVINEGSAGIRLLNLLSPFTLLQTLPNLSFDDSTKFDSMVGEFSFADGNIIVESLALKGDEIDINVTGSTNMVSEHNDLVGSVTLNRSDDIATGALTFTNPLAGAVLLAFDKLLNAPLIGKLRLDYKVTGTWGEPEIIQLGNEQEEAR